MVHVASMDRFYVTGWREYECRSIALSTSETGKNYATYSFQACFCIVSSGPTVLFARGALISGFQLLAGRLSIGMLRAAVGRGR